MADFIIDDQNAHLFIDPTVNGEIKKRGLVLRNYETHPEGCHKGVMPFKAIDMPTLPRDQLVDIVKEAEATKSRLSDIRRSSGPSGGIMPSLDQDGVGYCWVHSVVMGIMQWRAKMGLPYRRLSAFFIGCLIKNFRDEGGWGAQGLEFAAEHGCADTDHWKEKSMDRANDNPETRANALLYKVDGVYADMSAAQYDRNVTEDQSMTLLALRYGHIGDFNWWGHSVWLMDLLLSTKAKKLSSARLKALLKTDFASLDLNKPKDAQAYADVFAKRGINSWTDDWGDKGEFVLEGTKAHVDGGAAIVSVVATAA